MSLIKKSPLVAASILATAMFSSGAFASTTDDYEGAVNITANIVSTGCSIDSGSGLNVDFGQVNAENRAEGDVVAERALNINLTCPSGSRSTVTTKFTGATMSNEDGTITPEPGSHGAGVNFEIIGASGVVNGNTNSTAVTSDLSSKTEIQQKYYVDAVRSDATLVAGVEHAYVNFEVDNT